MRHKTLILSGENHSGEMRELDRCRIKLNPYKRSRKKISTKAKKIRQQLRRQQNLNNTTINNKLNFFSASSAPEFIPIYRDA